MRLAYRRGIPPGLDLELLQKIVKRITDSGLRSTQYRQMSGWKKSGAYRLLLRTSAGKSLSLVYKNAVYSEDEIPALVDLPIMPGAGEYFFFRHSSKNLANYFPRVYCSEELKKKQHFRYVMEDLTQTYRVLVSDQDRVSLCRALPKIHATFESLASHPDSQNLLKYDRMFADWLLVYSLKSLQALQELQLGPSIDCLLNDWETFSDIFHAGTEAVYKTQPLTLIHGDCNISNAMCHKDKGSFKILDLEWAGWGVPHHDLVSALDGAPAELKARCVEDFSINQGKGRLDRDWHIYCYCAIQRALLDAGFVGKQILNSTARTPKWFPSLSIVPVSRRLTSHAS